MCSEEEDSTEPTDEVVSRRGDDDAPGAPPATERAAMIKEGDRPKRRRRKRRGRMTSGVPTEDATTPTTSTMSSTAPASPSAVVEAPKARSQSPRAPEHAGFRLLRAALDHAEEGDYDSALEALVQLLLCGEEPTSRTQLFDVSYQKNRGGWRATISLATGRQFCGPVKNGQSAARAAAMESAMDYLARVGLHITTTVRTRFAESAKEESTSLARRLSPRAKPMLSPTGRSSRSSDDGSLVAG